MSETAKNFLLDTFGSFFGNKDYQLSLDSENALSEFIHNPQHLHLQCFIAEDNSFLIGSRIKSSPQKSLVVYKTSPQEMTSTESLSNLNIFTLSATPVESLYHLLKQIYSPLLNTENDLISNKIQQNIAELESNLRAATYSTTDKRNNSVILSIDDEIDYWKNISQKKELSSKEKEAAATFLELFELIAGEIRTMEGGGAGDAREAAENAGALLDDVWRVSVFPYGQERMKATLDLVGYTICGVVQRRPFVGSLWTAQGDATAAAADALAAVATWTSACRSLTETYWPNYSLHYWTAGVYVPAYCVKFEQRMREIVEVRSTHDQLSKILSDAERAELQTDRVLKLFEGIGLSPSAASEAAWRAARGAADAALRPAEARVADKLRPRLQNISATQMLYEFMRHSALIARPAIKRALTPELDAFVTSLAALLKDVQGRLDAETGELKLYRPPDTSPLVLQVQWAKQMEARVMDIESCVRTHLGEYERSGELLQRAARALQELKQLYTSLHEDWARDLQASVKSGELRLAADAPALRFTARSLLAVTLSARCEAAAHEARCMAALALPPPPAARAALDDMLRVMQHARDLQQVASFHNTLGERMVPSTRPMMLAAALRLSALVQGRGAAWGEPAALQHYVAELKECVFTLETQNTYLTSQHAALGGVVRALADTELLAKQAEWKAGVNEMRNIIDGVTAKGYKNTEAWINHWDWQLYKALEVQYVRTLHSLHTHYPAVRVDLLFRGRSVRASPPIEELRAASYSQLRRFVAAPAHFVGLRPAVGDAASIYTDIVAKHSWLGNKAVSQIEATLASLQRLCGEWTRRLAVARVPDLEEYCAQHLHQPEDWERNFKACKAFGQAVAKMTFDDERIDWLLVSTLPLRRECEAQVRSLWACLVATLQAKCREHAATVDAFVANARLALECKMVPKNSAEFAEMNARQLEVKTKMPETEAVVGQLQRMSHMLQGWVGALPVQGSLRAWRDVRALADTQRHVLQQQAEMVKSSLGGAWANAEAAAAAWLARWSARRPAAARAAPAADMAARAAAVFEASAQFDAMRAERDKLMSECGQLDMTPDVSPCWAEAETLINEDVALWTPLREYNEELSALAGQEWAVFAARPQQLDELAGRWRARLEPYTAVTLFLQQELDKFTDLTPVLKYLRGPELTERHWREIFALLDMEYRRSEELTAGDILERGLSVKKHVKALQKISVSAAGEAAVRGALGALDVWFAGARLPLAAYRDAGGRDAPVVKDFKQVLAKIEEQQWVVSSVRGGAGGAGGDECAAWEARLRSAAELVRATSHAQRRD